ncbi:unnamed protein product [Allacma fusca]|uniref:Uncharacterized protein n=1 Tax=Allacma fusca TaxID=39272 RepID=A0A8J2P0S4_9HEXA|nr:unnamed protein product [Allacma fusca]
MGNIHLMLFFFFGSTLVFSICHGAPQTRQRTEVSIYEHQYYQGRALTISLGSRCKTFRGFFRNTISSAMLNSECVQLCRDDQCDECTEIRESSADLSEINFNDRVRSIKQCNESLEY